MQTVEELPTMKAKNCGSIPSVFPSSVVQAMTLGFYLLAVPLCSHLPST